MDYKTSRLITVPLYAICRLLRPSVIEHQWVSGGTDDFTSSECEDGKTV
jgi:hypothetical protein